MTVQAAGKNEIINALSDIPAILEDKDTQALGSGKILFIEKLILILQMERTQVIIRKHCRHHFKMSNTR